MCHIPVLTCLSLAAWHSNECPFFAVDDLQVVHHKAVVKSNVDIRLKLAFCRGFPNLDISDFQKFVEGKGRLIFAYGESEQGRQDAVKQAIEKASAKTSSSEPCELLMINVTGSEENMSMSEIVKTTEEIQAALAGDQCSIIWGANVDDNLGDAVRVSIWMRR